MYKKIKLLVNIIAFILLIWLVIPIALLIADDYKQFKHNLWLFFN